MLHILHAADLHLDAPFAALTAEQARQRRAEQRLLLDALADAAIERGADLVVLAGDLLDSGQTYREVREWAARTKDFVNVIWKPEAAVMGDAIPVSGNGDQTND